MRKLMDAGRLKKLGWEPEISLEEGLADTYQWFRKHQESFRGW
jgi:GDP-L-fucose synthase